MTEENKSLNCKLIIYREELSDRSDELVDGFFYTAGYDSPMKFWNRRNEVMFEKKNNEVDIV